MIAFNAVTSAQAGTASTTQLTWVGSPNGGILLALFGFEGVAPGSGPWIDENGHDLDVSGAGHGWKRLFYQAPSNTGCGLEMWGTCDWSSGADTDFPFLASYSYVARGAQYTGQLSDTSGHVTGGTYRAVTSSQWTGNNPEAPSVYAFENELVIAVSALEMSSPGFGTPTPSGWSQRLDSARSGFGTVEITLADTLMEVEGATGQIPWSASAETGSSKGGTATLAVRPTAAVVAATSPLIAVEYAVPL